MMKKQITCIVCPRGCVMTAEGSGDNWSVTGNACKRGEKHAIGECVNPVRTVTSTVRVDNRQDTMLPVKTENPIPKGEMFAVMERIRAATVSAPVKIGDVIIDQVFGTRIVAAGEIR